MLATIENYVPEKTTNVKVLVIEGDKVKRIGLKGAIEEHPDLSVVAVVDTAPKAFYYLQLTDPNVVIIDLMHIGAKGLETICKIKEKCPAIKIITLSSGQDKEEIKSCIGAGANAYCLNNIPGELLSRVIKTVNDGACWFDPSVAETVMNCFPKPNYLVPAVADQYYEPLSSREIQVLRLLVQGKSNTIIAKELIVSVHTAKAHVCNILHKLNVTDRVQAAVKAVNCKLVEAV